MKLMTRVRQAIRDWYVGEFEAYPNAPSSPIVVLGGWYRRHWTAEVARTCVDFYLRHWQWVLGFILAVIGIVLSI